MIFISSFYFRRSKDCFCLGRTVFECLISLNKPQNTLSWASKERWSSSHLFKQDKDPMLLSLQLPRPFGWNSFVPLNTEEELSIIQGSFSSYLLLCAILSLSPLHTWFVVVRNCSFSFWSLVRGLFFFPSWIQRRWAVAWKLVFNHICKYTFFCVLSIWRGKKTPLLASSM